MALALLAALFFSIKAIFVKLAYQYGVDAITLLTLRMAFALPVFIVVAIIGQRKSSAQKITLHQSMSIIGLGLVGYYLASMLDFVGLQYVSASIERLILFLFPTFTILLSMFFLGRRVSRDMAVLNQPVEVYEYGLAIALLSTVLPAFMLAAAIHRIGASHTSIIGSIGPVATIVLAVLLLGESMTGLQIGGALLVVAGVLLLGLLRRKL